MTTWMVRAGRNGRFFQDFRDRQMVAVGWPEVGDLRQYDTRERMAEAVRRAFPTYRDQAVNMAAGQLLRFAREFREGDRVVTYDPGARRYLCGEIAGPYVYHSDEDNQEFVNQREGAWQREVARDNLSENSQNSLGAISTIFLVPESAAAELWGESQAGVARDTDQVALERLAVGQSDEEVASLASEAIKDRLAELSWEDMQEVVAGLLRAMGYKTTISPTGPDRGKDIVASPDGFGFREPRIVVEVKHRRGERVGSQQIRSFLGGRHPHEKGLYVSTGGFSKEAYYEAERANIPLTLLDFESLVEAIFEHYPMFDEETRQILPLRRIYWPITR